MSESSNGNFITYDEGSSVCFVCNAQTTFGTRNALDIFNDKVLFYPTVNLYYAKLLNSNFFRPKQYQLPIHYRKFFVIALNQM